jgi:lipopolysaccharide/colanic/teichoic acid biosynthesis glycosyltransferase
MRATAEDFMEERPLSAYELFSLGTGATTDELPHDASGSGEKVRGDRGSQLEGVPSPLWSDRMSEWSGSSLKRAFDFVCVFCAMPILVPFLLVVALAVRLTSRGPVLFLQQRVGLLGRPFTILKFRTMVHHDGKGSSLVTTASDQRFTPIGPFLRSWKLDEVPQLLNVLAGQMSLVGPRPKVPQYESGLLPCRPGITGAATIVFAREERALDRIPKPDLNEFYNTVVLPAKRELDADYLARATFFSDLIMIVNSATGRWNSRMMQRVLRDKAMEVQHSQRKAQSAGVREMAHRVPLNIGVMDTISVENDSVA